MSIAGQEAATAKATEASRVAKPDSRAKRFSVGHAWPNVGQAEHAVPGAKG